MPRGSLNMSKTADRLQWAILVIAVLYFAGQVVRWGVR